jgi:diadenosine tetraphosphatase ApaH/serine/threonine PP2A family protein phosphatase
MRVAFVADIHANLHAFQAVLRDIAGAGMEVLVNLGDVVGYGAHPAECVELLRKLGTGGVMGNHDFYVSSSGLGIDIILEEPGVDSNPVWAGVKHSRKELDPDQMEWLRNRPPIEHIAGAIAAHAALHEFEDWPYLLSPDDARPTLELLDDRIGFFAHTHDENVFAEPDAGVECIGESRFILPEGKAVAVTAGATGQPRDGDPRARWLSWDTEAREIEFRRVAYDNEAAAAAIIKAGLPEHSALRLLG